MIDRDLSMVGVDFERANAARMYDYLLGGAHNFAIDREHADRIIAGNPNAVWVAQANRTFLRHAVERCLARGIDQFLDLGSGVPTVGNVHEIVHRHRRDARVAYVDYEPVAVAHSTEIISNVDSVSVTHADIRDHDTVLAAPGVAGLLDFERPVALLAVAVLHFIADDVAPIVARYRDHLVPGSALVISHISDDHDDDALVERTRGGAQAQSSSASPLTLRTRAQLLALLDGLDLESPGLVDVAHWPDPNLRAEPTGIYGAAAFKP